MSQPINSSSTVPEAHANALIAVANAPARCGCGTTAEVNAGSCKPQAGSFPRFFAGQLVQPDDLTAIEKRSFFHEQLRARHLFGWGIACGFRVAIEGTPRTASTTTPAPPGVRLASAVVHVEPGFAIDPYGRDVAMPNDARLSLETLFAERQSRISKAMADPWCVVPGCVPTPPTRFCIAVRYREQQQNLVPSYAQQSGTPATVCEYSGVREDVELRLFGDNELPGAATPPASSGAAWLVNATDRSALFAWFFEFFMEYPDPAQSAEQRQARLNKLISMGSALSPQTLAESDDLLHLPQPCASCVDSPWIPLASFTLVHDEVTPADYSVRRVLYSLQELGALVIKLFWRLGQQHDVLK